MIIERKILTGLIVSDAFIKRVADGAWGVDQFESPEMRQIARWAFEHYAKYGKAPNRDIEQIFLAAVRDEFIPKADAKHIEDILGVISDEYEHGEDINVDYLYDQMVQHFRTCHLKIGIEDANILLQQGKIDHAITAVAEATADAIETMPTGDLSRARVAAWRIAMAGGPEERLPDPWGDPEPPEFDLRVLPRMLRRYVETRSAMIGVGANAMAWTTIAACGAALDASIRLQLKPLDFTFTVPPGIWLLLVGLPSSRKTPTLRAPFAPLYKIQEERITACERERAAWLAEDTETRGPEPNFVQLLTNNQTPEGIRDALVGQDRGITILADEWAGHIGTLGRYAGGRDAGAADRAFFNTAFDGGPYTSNRANRKGGDRIAVANLQVTVVGGVQPDVLRQFNRRGELLGDGMLQRSCPILMGRPALGRDVDGAEAIREYNQLIQRLIAAAGNRVVRMTPEAEAIRRRLEAHFLMLEQSEALGQGFATAAGKLHGIWGRLALTLEHVLSAHREEPSEIIGARAATLAERLVVESLIPNMARFYQALGTGGDVETTRAIAAFLLRQQRVRVTGRDIVLHVGMLHRSRVEHVREAVSPLVNMSWLTPERPDERGASAWIVNPAIYEQFAEKAAKARADAALARSLIATSVGRNASATAEPDAEEDREPAASECL